MKMKLSFCACAMLAAVSAVKAGPVELESKELAPAPTLNDTDHWQLNLGSPGWLASVSGDIGLNRLLFYRLSTDFVPKFVSLNIVAFPVRNRSKPFTDHREPVPNRTQN